MASAEACAFYGSPAWKAAREAYKKSVGGLCERCLAKGIYSPGEIVHHKIRVSPETLHSPELLTGFDNLELLCRRCHGEEHDKKKRRYTVDALGRIAPR